MLNYITISLVFILLAFAVIILFKNVILYLQQSKDRPEKESEFIYKLISEGKLKLDKASEDDFTVSHITNGEAFTNKNAYNELSINEVQTAISEKISGLSEEKIRQFLNYLDEGQIPEKRRYDRKDFVRIIDYTVGERYYRDFIRDISGGGLFIETSNEFSAGQNIIMTFVSLDYQRPFKINGKIIHAQTDGVGVKFKIESQVQESVLKSYVNMIQT
jgi:Tfp pilus assembly protein PilZ